MVIRVLLRSVPRKGLGDVPRHAAGSLSGIKGLPPSRQGNNGGRQGHQRSKAADPSACLPASGFGGTGGSRTGSAVRFCQMYGVSVISGMGKVMGSSRTFLCALSAWNLWIFQSRFCGPTGPNGDATFQYFIRGWQGLPSLFYELLNE